MATFGFPPPDLIAFEWLMLGWFVFCLAAVMLLDFGWTFPNRQAEKPSQLRVYFYFLGFGSGNTGATAPSRLARGLARHVLSSLNLCSTGQIFAAGCGTGQIAVACSMLGRATVGVDISRISIVMAMSNTSRRLLGRLQFRLLDAANLHTCGCDRFDGVYTVQSLAHMDNVSAALTEFHRIIRPGGRMALYECEHAAEGKIYLSLPWTLLAEGGRIALSDHAALAADSCQAAVQAAGFTGVCQPRLGWMMRATAGVFFLSTVAVYALAKRLTPSRQLRPLQRHV